MLALLAALAAPQAAKAEGLPASRMLSAFEAMCLATNADAKAVLAEADRQNWVEKPSGRWSKVDGLVRLGTEAGNQQGLILETTQGEVAGLSMTQRRCGIMAEVNDPSTMLELAQKLVGSVKPAGVWEGARQWTYTQTNQGAVQISTMEAAKEAIRTGRFRQLLVSDTQSGNSAGNVGLEIIVGSPP